MTAPLHSSSREVTRTICTISVAPWQSTLDHKVADRLSKASAAACRWANSNGDFFEHRKTEALFLSRRRRGPTATIESEGRRVPFNERATRWLGIWLASQLTLREHQRAMLKKGKKAMAQVRRLTGQLGLTPSNCRKVMTACVQSVAMYGVELWWKGTGNRGTGDSAQKLQQLVNQEARAVTGCLWRTNSGPLVVEAGLRPATAQLDNRMRRYGLRLLSLAGQSGQRHPGSTNRTRRAFGGLWDIRGEWGA
jgi:hypothetical protein